MASSEAIGGPEFAGDYFWPRCVRALDPKTLLVADGISGVLARYDVAAGRWTAVAAFTDPHDVRALDDGGLLVTDSVAGEVMELDRAGRTRWTTADVAGLEVHGLAPHRHLGPSRTGPGL